MCTKHTEHEQGNGVDFMDFRKSFRYKNIRFCLFLLKIFYTRVSIRNPFFMIEKTYNDNRTIQGKKKHNITKSKY